LSYHSSKEFALSSSNLVSPSASSWRSDINSKDNVCSSLISHLNQDKKQITFTNVVVDLQDRLGTGEIETVRFKNEYDLHFTANSILVNAYAGFNIEQAVIG